MKTVERGYFRSKTVNHAIDGGGYFTYCGLRVHSGFINTANGTQTFEGFLLAESNCKICKRDVRKALNEKEKNYDTKT